MSELALYRKYRSQTFDQVIGQAHVVTTLTNALASDRISHAYLLTGPRGVGKTSVARLLARAVNCTASKGAKPCNECDVCQIPLASNMDIIEIDAASNRRIDEMRDLRDKINLSPAQSRYKIYIIDEVHMLTTEAFNALLKTLEEPPAHAIFILATTEVHKLPETIISRTQRFNFKAISQADLEQHLATIAKQEGITIEPSALTLIAETSRGGFRDAISLLDQVANTSESSISAESVQALLGLSDAKALDGLAAAITTHQPKEALTIIDSLNEQGVQTGQLVTQLINYWRRLLLDRLSNNLTGKAAIDTLSTTDITGIINKFSEVLQAPLIDVALETTVVELALRVTTTTPVVSAASPSPSKPDPVPLAATPDPVQPAANVEVPSGELWPKTLLLIKVQNNSLYALLCSCQIELSSNQIIINCRFNFHRDRLNEPKNRQIIEAALTKVYGKPMTVISQLELAPAKAAMDPSAELVSSALEILGGEVVDG